MKKYLIWILVIEVQLLVGSIVYFSGKLDQLKAVNRIQANRIIELENSIFEKQLTEVNAGDLIIGDENAPVEMIMYTRFDCPICQDFFINKYQHIKREFIETGMVRLIIRNLVHRSKPENLFLSANIHRFFESENLMLERKIELIDSTLMGYDLNNLGDFSRSIEDLEERLLDNAKRYRSLGIRETPTFFINGRKIVGERTIERFEKIIEESL